MSVDQRRPEDRKESKEPRKDKEIQDLPEKDPTPSQEESVKGGAMDNRDLLQEQ